MVCRLAGGDIIGQDLHIDLRQHFLTRQLIAYIGNKRSLLPFLHHVFAGLLPNDGRGVFLDPFAGSGAVSRLAKAMGFQVRSNDWEPYADIVNRCHIGLDADDMVSAFARDGGIEKAFREICAEGEVGDPYISRYYSPQDTEKADYRSERLFYTRENGLFVDRVRERIDRWYPASDSIERTLLLASLVYQAATHANTNGVFKAFHRGFGGFGEDALVRILKPMALQIPLLVNGLGRCEVRCEDALSFSRARSALICYLDPPNNQHQYGSNYHLLNSIVLWDKPPVDTSFGADGRLKEKAGIRKDWTKTRSPYCYRSTAVSAMRDLLHAIDSRWIVVSYNTEGIIPFWELFELFAETGSVSVRTSDYLVYRGGKQSLTRAMYNQEFLFVVDRNALATTEQRRGAERFLLEKKVAVLARSGFHPGRLREKLAQIGSVYTFHSADGSLVECASHFGYDISIDPGEINRLSLASLSEMQRVLEYCRTTDMREEAIVLLELILENPAEDKKRKLQLRLIRVLKKFAFRKYRREFVETLDTVYTGLLDQVGDNAEILAKLKDVERIAHLRFNS